MFEEAEEDNEKYTHHCYNGFCTPDTAAPKNLFDAMN